MARRKVTHTRKYNRSVVALGNPEEWWSPRATDDVIVDIESRLHRYYVTDAAGRIVAVRRVTGPIGQRLHAPDRDGGDLLQRLPDC